jgi:hypothetical protein
VKRMWTFLMALTAALALSVGGYAAAAQAVPSNPDVEPCVAEPGFPGICRDENWPAPPQYQATGRDRDLDASAEEAIDLAASHCPGYDTVRLRSSHAGNIYTTTLTYTC